MTSSIVPIASLLLSAFFMLLGVGLSGYLIPLRAVQEGWSTFEISMIATGYAIAFTAGCLAVPRLVLRVGHVRVFAVLAALMSISLLMHALIVHPAAWILFRGLTGFSIAGGYMVIESWLNERVTNETRGTVFSVYMVIAMIAVMLGQFMVPLGNPLTASLFMVCAIVFALALMPTGLSNAQSPQPLTQVSVNIFALYRKSPAAVVGAALAGVITGAWNNLAPVFAQLNGLSTATGATMLAVAMIGGALFQFPLGRMSDRIDRRYVMALAGVIGVAACVLNLLVGTSNIYLFLVFVLLLGAVMYPIYSLVVAHANDYAQADEFVSTSSGLLIVYGGGTMFGPPISGLLMDNFGNQALFTVMGASFALYGGYAYFRSFRRPQASEEERVEFQAIPLDRAQTPQTYELDPRVELGDETETAAE
ncbi:MFS transporter [Nitratireductor sp. XY-223]|uniref:MFS transporter n=1 Tax=Nitratireductor sp. XY-223 TaxID=2561926 RepID=UPI0010AAC35F|nr:MFS transporter [Nitratireductor sp. XY-223]